MQNLNDLHTNGIVHYSYENTTSKLLFLVTRDDNYTINYISKNIETNILENLLKKNIQKQA